MTVHTAPKPENVAPSRSAVHSWDEFTQLREIVVGDATGARIPRLSDPSAWLACYARHTRSELEVLDLEGRFPDRVIEESNEDLEILARTLSDMGVRVHRPPSVDHSAPFGSPDWTTEGYISYCPRDLTLVVGETIIETASPMRARYFELFNLRELFQQYLRDGARWIAAPRPRLRDELFTLDADGLPLLGEDEPVFDAANVVRIGRDVLYQVSRSGNEMGLTWLRSVLGLLGDITVHPLRDVYGYTHIDSTITILRPGLVLLNPARIGRDEVPEPFRGWDVLWCPEPIEHPMATGAGLSEPWICMNLLMVNPGLAIVDEAQPQLGRALESRGITVVPLPLRHQRALGGGFHCVTLDTVRDGGPEDYLAG